MKVKIETKQSQMAELVEQVLHNLKVLGSIPAVEVNPNTKPPGGY